MKLDEGSIDSKQLSSSINSNESFNIETEDGSMSMDENGKFKMTDKSGKEIMNGNTTLNLNETK